MHEITVEQVLNKFPFEHLRELATFGALSDECILDLLENGHLMELAPGDALYEAGSSADEFYVIIDGTLDLFHHFEDKRAPTRTYHAGDQLGFVGIIALHPHRGTAIACETCWTVAISSSQFFDLNHTAPENFGLLMINLSRGMARTISILGDVITELQH
ncbi:MAG: cyclic nucleotide-binding domain-containing protein [Marinobacter sp.]|uniref:cyclic nucleotide-binding domain-containing protein n=1 Tax=Marinobacter sp. TaxID=50741 RepID=UPI003299BB5A